MRQMNRAGRRMAAGAALLVAAPVVMSSVAYACQTLATLHATTPSVTAGSTVTLFGKNYAASVSPAESAQPSAISIRLDTKTGPVIGTFAAAANRTLSGTVTIPAGTAAGEHTLLATQTTAAGLPVSGTPGRATVQITVAAKTSADDAVASPVVAAVTESTAAVTATTPVLPTAMTPVAITPVVANQAAPTVTPVAPAALAPAATVETSATATLAAPAAAVTTAVVAAVAAPSTEPAGPASVSVSGLLPASSQSSGLLPGLTMAAGLALVLLSLGAFVKSGRTILGGRGITPLAG